MIGKAHEQNHVPFNISLFGFPKNLDDVTVPILNQNLPLINNQAGKWKASFLFYVNPLNTKLSTDSAGARIQTFYVNLSNLISSYFAKIGFHRSYTGIKKQTPSINKEPRVYDNSIVAKKEGNNQTKHFMASFIICSILWFVLTLLIFFRIIQSNHFPLANFYEALVFLTWCLVTLNFIILLEPSGSSSLNFSVQKQVSGAILAPCILFIIAFAQFNLSADITPLVPALKSNWLLMHVSIMICSYTTFMVGGLLSILLLMQTIYSYSQTLSLVPSFQSESLPIKKSRLRLSSISLARRERNVNIGWEARGMDPTGLSVAYSGKQDARSDGMEPNTTSSGQNSYPSFEHVLEGPSKMQKKNFYIILDNLSYRMMGIGFPLFTLGILSGAVWANEAWGSYWSWDIKEVGSFINWLLVALYFHCRYKNFITLSHVVAFISLMVLFFNFFGISLGIFGSSLHAYGATS